MNVEKRKNAARALKKGNVVKNALNSHKTF
jgi:hypothetical protein